ncbi:MAG: NADH-quinone oxidoreductase subunit D [Actinomyces sp.]|jgi:NADH-quinone oxidoreductase subunit D|nr:NADH-quinone oxidoreductase subunit D [Actinomyces sp.]MCI1641867.1 NADH-quinone oxidoreductase subunit D [Actinomyces sp.]MCI1662047.1 NADH-quinone oxidoreductase subunit D [Actinomyces sp.]MCI1690753.1 NADH-quinone oxidoreductase subunit D [Actinomyces sp.]MCI1787252.1 NADH-quinone oxidoreductase subunit D [Actinomyces sp.]MCI1829646.1 NADH-quinone oxidoreductase subunit D [Actinomyces sp.]
MSEKYQFHATPGTGSIDVDEVPEVLAQGGDWEDVLTEIQKISTERVVVNLGPVHPSTHGVLRLIVELDGEVVRQVRVDTGYLHTGIEKNMEFRTWTQGVTFCTRMDYVAPFFQEVEYCLAVEKLLGITDDVPERATLIRVLMMELNRIASHIVAIASTGNEMGGTTFMTIGFRGREEILRIFERITGLRMNHAYIRPGGVAQDLPQGMVDYIREKLPKVRHDVGQLQDLALQNPIFKKRFIDIGYLPLSAITALGVTGPIAKAAGLPLDMRKTRPYCGYEDYEFDVPTYDKSDCYNRAMVRFDECYQSLRIVNQVLDRLEATEGQPVMVDDPAIAWPAQLSVATDGQGNSLEHISTIMGQSMESLIHHFKLVTEGFHVPAGQAYQLVEHAKGIAGVHLVSDGGTRPYRAHFRDPSFHNLQSLAMMAEGGQLADLIMCLASIDPVLGGVDR